MMKRRGFITLLGGAAAWPLAASAQETGRIYRIGVITRSPRMGKNYVAFFDELRRQGFVEGQNLAVDARGFAARSEQFPELAAALVNSGIDALVCGGAAAIRAAQHATQTIPIEWGYNVQGSPENRTSPGFLWLSTRRLRAGLQSVEISQTAFACSALSTASNHPAR